VSGNIDASNATFAGNAAVAGSAVVYGTLSANGTVAMGEDLHVTGDLYTADAFVAALDASSNAIIRGTLTVLSNVDAQGDLDVTGTARAAAMAAAGDLSASNASLAGGLTVTGSSVLGSVTAATISVSGAASTGAFDCDGTLDVKGEAVLRSNAAVLGTMEVVGALSSETKVIAPDIQADTAQLGGVTCTASALQVSGDALISGTASASDFTLLSDEKHKTSVQPLTAADAWDTLQGVVVKRFDFGGSRRQGVIAQEAPSLYVTPGSDGDLRVRYIDMLCTLFTAVQDLGYRMRAAGL